MAAEGRDCLRGHGRMDMLQGWFALVGLQIDRGTPVGLLSEVPALVKIKVGPNGQMLAVRAWRCSTCGVIELVDREMA